MNSIIDLVYVDGNLLLTFVNMFVLFIAFDFLITFAGLIKSIRGAVL